MQATFLLANWELFFHQTCESFNCVKKSKLVGKQFGQRMEFVLPFSFSDFPEDVHILILSFLNPSELDLFALTSTRFLALCRDEDRVWFLKCSRRWGSQTQIHKWGGRKISYRHLYHFLEKYENLVGFWYLHRLSKVSVSTFLVCFEWGSFYITGYKIWPSESGGYGVTKKPFLWITATSNGKGLNYLDSSTDGTSVSLTDKDLLREDSEKLRGKLILVDIRLPDNGKGRAEYESVYRCPPDGLMAKIYEILGGKLISATNCDTTSKREKRRERQREKEKWRLMHRWEAEEFVRAIDSPTPSRPLQGLWKGVSPNGSLTLYLVCYGFFDHISCRDVGGSSTFESCIVFRASSRLFIESPYSPGEESMYNSRVHVQPRADQAGSSSDDHDLLRIFYADSKLCPSSFLSGNSDDADGRIWIYTNGTFGFGFLPDDFIVDLKPMLKNGRLLDLVM